ncbi:MAG: patatin-like phospholipase family protein [Acetobacteraceae bacterium]|nr:patatin-like phospholipase family protein [Acetobacteraceae bacterium]
MGKTLLALGGGAPNFTAMTGVLRAFHEADLRIDHVSMTGGGMVAGLLYLAPKGGDRAKALENTVNLGVSDAIYAAFPVNYKVFQKSGRGADRFRAMMSANPRMRRWLDQSDMSHGQKLVSDWIQLMAAMMSPTDLNWFSQGMCAHAPFIEEVVDFEALKRSEVGCTLGAYCLEDHKTRRFGKDEITPDAFRAGLAFPFIYPPFRFSDGKHYIEGASFHALNLQDLITEFSNDPSPENHVDSVILIDVLRQTLIAQPRTLWEGYSQSVITPIIGMAKKELAMFRTWIQHGVNVEEHHSRRDVVGDRKTSFKSTSPLEELAAEDRAAATTRHVPLDRRPTLYEVMVTVPEDHRGDLLSWKRSNLDYLFHLGYFSGIEFARHAKAHGLFQRSSEAPEELASAAA